MIQHIEENGSEYVLEVVAGTGICGRTIASYVKDIICLDLTEAMLEEEKNLPNRSKFKI